MCSQSLLACNSGQHHLHDSGAVAIATMYVFSVKYRSLPQELHLGCCLQADLAPGLYSL